MPEDGAGRSGPTAASGVILANPMPHLNIRPTTIATLAGDVGPHGDLSPG